MSDVERRTASAAIFGKVVETDYFRRAGTVALFMSLPDEPQTEDFLREMRHCKRLVVPRVSEGGVIDFYVYSPDRLQYGAFGIIEPSTDAEMCPVNEIDLIVVPGVAFTRDGCRLGRGGGFYDRFLGRSDLHAATIGICFDVQIVSSLPTEEHDRRVDMVITER